METSLQQPSITIAELTELVEGTLRTGDPARKITGLNAIDQAGVDEVTFLGNPRYAAALQNSRAAAVLVAPNHEGPTAEMAVIEVSNPTLAFSRVIRLFTPQAKAAPWGIHESAVVEPSARFDAERVSIGPNVYVGEDVVIGNGTILRAGCVVSAGSVLGQDCEVYPNVVIRNRCVLGNRVIIHAGAVIGSDGFGYEFVGGRHQKIEQVGIVQIDDDVEIGSCTTIDRARFGRTWIGEGTKIDNLVQIAHNCVIGKYCIIVAQTGISGSTKLGNGVTIGGQAGVAGHLEVCSGAMLLARSGVTKNLTAPGAYTGFPARPLMEGRKLMAYPTRVPELLDRVKKLEQRLAALEKQQD